jgi:D-alanyl-lipoteichoic acid acyltransferase DltB (MBOAT superfamily)
VSASLGWQPRLFVTLGGPPRTGAGALLWNGVWRLLVGAGCVVAAGTIWAVATVLPETRRLLVATLVLLTGLSLMLHFGVFNILAGLWRFAGVACGSLFRAPLRSTSLGEFWGRRWNLALGEMTAIAVYRPLAGRLGNGPALVGAFLFSGLLHGIAITVPIQTAYGLPMLYFLLHGSLVQVEHWLERRGTPVNRLAWVGRVWTLGWLFLPLGVLFPPPFLQGVVWPIVGIEPARTP